MRGACPAGMARQLLGRRLPSTWMASAFRRPRNLPISDIAVHGERNTRRLTNPMLSPGRGIRSSLRKKKFRSKFEVHRIEVVPLPTPNEAVFFEDHDDLLRHAVAIKDAAAMRAPVPIIREGGIEIDRDAVAVRARLSSVRYGPAIVAASDRVCGAFDFVGQRVDLCRYGAQMLIDVVQGRGGGWGCPNPITAPPRTQTEEQTADRD